jgi:septum formation protein
LASKIENAQAEFTIVQNAGKQIPDYIIVADTLVEDPDDPTVSLGQPADKIGAAAMLLRLTGRRHNVWSGTAVISKLSVGWEVKSAVEYATVEIKQLADSDFAELLESDSWVGKAGAYDLAGEMRQFADLYAGSEMCVLGFAPSIIEDLIQRLSNDVKK